VEEDQITDKENDLAAKSCRMNVRVEKRKWKGKPRQDAKYLVMLDPKSIGL
jgi:hypothetical protein